MNIIYQKINLWQGRNSFAGLLKWRGGLYKSSLYNQAFVGKGHHSYVLATNKNISKWKSKKYKNNRG